MHPKFMSSSDDASELFAIFTAIFTPNTASTTATNTVNASGDNGDAPSGAEM